MASAENSHLVGTPVDRAPSFRLILARLEARRLCCHTAKLPANHRRCGRGQGLSHQFDNIGHGEPVNDLVQPGHDRGFVAVS